MDGPTDGWTHPFKEMRGRIKDQVRICGRNELFIGYSLPAENNALRTDKPTDPKTNGQTYPLIVSWLKTSDDHL